MASDSKILQERYDFLAGNFLNIQTLEDAWKAMRFIFDRAEEKWACDDLTLLSYRPEKKIQKSYFRVFYLSLKLDELVDVSLSDKEWIIRCLEVFGEATEKCIKLHPTILSQKPSIINKNKFNQNSREKLFKSEISNQIVVKSILEDAQDIKDELKSIQQFSRDKAANALSKAFPVPRKDIFDLLDKFVETQDEEDPDNDEVWTIQENNSRIDEQKIVELYVAMTEIFVALKKNREWMMFEKVLKFMKFALTGEKDESKTVVEANMLKGAEMHCVCEECERGNGCQLQP